MQPAEHKASPSQASNAVLPHDFASLLPSPSLGSPCKPALRFVTSCHALQVSELSHKLGSAQGSSQSLEQEVAQLRSQLKQLAGEKHSLEVQLSDTKAKLLALQEKVGPLLSHVRGTASHACC
jgi:septal ring factor EnvC (AmiA/AmiB activator)